MDEVIVEKLNESGLQKFIPVFQEQEVKWQDFVVMSEATLATFVPKAGPRAQLLAVQASMKADETLAVEQQKQVKGKKQKAVNNKALPQEHTSGSELHAEKKLKRKAENEATVDVPSKKHKTLCNGYVSDGINGIETENLHGKKQDTGKLGKKQKTTKVSTGKPLQAQNLALGNAKSDSNKPSKKKKEAKPKQQTALPKKSLVSEKVTCKSDKNDKSKTSQSLSANVDQFVEGKAAFTCNKDTPYNTDKDHSSSVEYTDVIEKPRKKPKNESTPNKTIVENTSMILKQLHGVAVQAVQNVRNRYSEESAASCNADASEVIPAASFADRVLPVDVAKIKKEKLDNLLPCGEKKDSQVIPPKIANTTASSSQRSGIETDSSSCLPAAGYSDTNVSDFSMYRISKPLITRLKAIGITSLFPVQSVSYNAIYDNHDVIVQARTGSGKTLSFAIPLVERLLKKDALESRNTRWRAPQLLVMTPTRELAKQVSDTFEAISNGLTVLCVYGGTPIHDQVRLLEQGSDIVIGTPGRLLDLIRRDCLDLKQLNHVVLDEVDRMLDMGFAEEVDKILKERYNEDAPDENPQTLMFSATMPSWIHKIAKKYLRPNIKKFDLVGDDGVKTSKTVQHLAICCGYFDRPTVISGILQVYSGSQGRAMVFCETKKEADELALSPEIRQEMHVLHGDIPQEKREMVLLGFREGRYKCLIATDVAARGLDIPEVDLVIQCCPPKDVDSYIHRSGRTGRAGRVGTCVLFYKPRQESDIGYVEKKTGIQFKRISPPSTADIIKACRDDAVRTLESVPETTWQHFKDLAENLVKEKNAVSLLSAALAIISGNSEMKPRSLLSSREGYTTFIYRTNIVMSNLVYVWRALERQVDYSIKEKVSWMTFCADKKGCVFDLPDEHVSAFQSQWKNTGSATIDIATELPELLMPQQSNTNGGGGQFYQRSSFGNHWRRGGDRGPGRFNGNNSRRSAGGDEGDNANDGAEKSANDRSSMWTSFNDNNDGRDSSQSHNRSFSRGQGQRRGHSYGGGKERGGNKRQFSRGGRGGGGGRRGNVAGGRRD